ncbi:twin-arginine translocation signal domain-containing protein [Sedimenticola hydrogenitrophicus]|uniref:twin-arginine translocation signal domain-containing protein n=1 Tax=Sedimenticola hydrogenitrophicus TaxID=2967975 RepID=UPI0021A373C5|nr:twin-arginine translocation signal domain-containing protein [Sedimenticola hydrogenitrophicus]
MKNDQKKTLNSDRRNFIRGSLAVGVGVATAAVMPGAVVAADADAPGQPPGQPKAQQGYRLTAHILEYYKSTAS